MVSLRWEGFGLFGALCFIAGMIIALKLMRLTFFGR